jgi:FtsZ-interacting cell division protein YlmF
MNERLRGLFGFLGLVDDEHGDFGPNVGRDLNAPEYEDSWSVGNERPLNPQSRIAARSPQPAPPQRIASQGRAIPSVTVLGANNGSPRTMEPMNSVRRGAPTGFNPSRDLQVVAPNSYNDVPQIVLILRENRAVLLSTAAVDKATQRQIRAFASGAAYALRATAIKLNEVRWLIVPQGLIVENEIVEKLKFANLADGQL